MNKLTNSSSCGKKFKPTVLHIFGGLVLLLVIAGCSTSALTSRNIASSGNWSNPRGQGASGQAYCLPMGRIHILATRVDTFQTNQAPVVVNVSRTNLVIDTSNATNYIPQRAQSIQYANQSAFTNSTKDTTSFTNTITTGTLTTNSAAALIANGTSFTSFSRLITRTKQTQPTIVTNYYYNITIEEKYGPDPANLFLLNPALDWNYDDACNVIVGANQLLCSINSTNTDQSGNVLVEIAKAAAAGLQLAVGFPAGLRPAEVREQAVPPKTIDVVFNPFDEFERTYASEALQKADLTLQTHVFFHNSYETHYANWRTPPTNEVGGILYRVLLPYVISIKDAKNNVISQTVLLPNESPTLRLDIRKYPLVGTVSQVSMTNGLVTGFSVNKPSQLLAGAKIPLQIISAFASLPTNLLQLKFDIATAKTKLIGQQTNEINALIAVINAQRQLLEAQKTNSAAAATH